MAGTALCGGLFATAGALLVTTNGLSARYSNEIERLAAFQDDSSSNDFRDGRCFISSSYSFADFNRSVCLHRDTARPNVLLMGDSHAAHLWSGLVHQRPDINFLQATVSGCRLVVGRTPTAPRCRKMMDYLFHEYLPERPVEWVILAGTWEAGDAADVTRTLDWLEAHHLKVILSGPIVRYQLPLPEALAVSMKNGDLTAVRRLRMNDGVQLDALYAKIAREHGAFYVSPYKALCRGDECRTTADAGIPVQFDYGHLTAAGSRLVAQAPSMQLPIPSRPR